MSGWQIHSYGALDEIQYSDSLKMPVLRSPNQVLVKVTASSVNPIDVAMISKCFLDFVGSVIDPFQLLFALVEMHFIPHCNCVMQVYEIFHCRDAAQFIQLIESDFQSDSVTKLRDFNFCFNSRGLWSDRVKHHALQGRNRVPADVGAGFLRRNSTERARPIEQGFGHR